MSLFLLSLFCSKSINLHICILKKCFMFIHTHFNFPSPLPLHKKLCTCHTPCFLHLKIYPVLVHSILVTALTAWMYHNMHILVCICGGLSTLKIDGSIGNCLFTFGLYGVLHSQHEFCIEFY